MSNMDRVVSRMERAGGALSEAVDIAEQIRTSADYVDAIVKVNVALGDLRRAGVRLANGEDEREVMTKLREQLAEVGAKVGR